MKKQSKNRKEKLENIDFSKSYNPAEAIKILKKMHLQNLMKHLKLQLI